MNHVIVGMENATAKVNTMTRIDCAISIYRNNQLFLQPVKVMLLKEIDLCGSMSMAARQLNISYMHAWNLVKDLNVNAPSPVVAMQRGGAQGGGATLTEYGRTLMGEVEAIEKQIKKVVDALNVEINL